LGFGDVKNEVTDWICLLNFLDSSAAEENISTIEMTFSATKKHGLQHFF
jgi:hypothetical protein